MSAAEKITQEIATIVDLRSLRERALALLKAELVKDLRIRAEVLDKSKVDTGATLWQYAVEVADLAIEKELRSYRGPPPSHARRPETAAEADVRRAQGRARRAQERAERAKAKRERAGRRGESTEPRPSSSASAETGDGALAEPSGGARGAEARALDAAQGARLLGEDVDAYIDRFFPGAGERVRKQARIMGAHAAALTSNRPYTADSESDSLEVP
jgi:hypothetical protein